MASASMGMPASSSNDVEPEAQGASIRQVLLEELVVTSVMTMQGQVEEGWALVQPNQTYRPAVC